MKSETRMPTGTPPRAPRLRARSWALAAVIALLILGPVPVSAQVAAGPRPPFRPAPVPQTGLHYYAIQNLDTGQVEQRGVTGSNGIAFSNLILAPNTQYRIWILQASTLAIANPSIITPGNGQRFVVPPLDLHVSASRDTDGDGLHNEGEFILGTINNPNDPHTKDSDQDGILDGAEVLQGLNPLDGIAVRTGLIGTADTPGNAVDVCAVNDIVAVADSGAGVTVFNVFNGMQPLAIAQVDTPGSADRVACSDNLIAVADGDAGLAVVDISDPPAARIRHLVPLVGAARAVTAGGGVAYVGVGSSVVSVDLASGVVLDELPFTEAVSDLVLAGDHLYVLLDKTLAVVALDEAALEVVGSSGAGSGYRRLFVGGDVAFAVHRSGFDTYDVSNPARPLLITTSNTTTIGWRHIVANGSGLAVAVLSPGPFLDASSDPALYDVSDRADNNSFVTSFASPGAAAAASIFNGIAYIADGDAGLQVVNYLAFDNQGAPPAVSLTTNLEGESVEEGKAVRATADVSDDVQVRNVEFYVDGQKVATDGNFPFEHRFIAPRISDKASFTLQARASDTGGNATFSDTLVIALVPDTTPPRVRRTVPGDGAVTPRLNAVVAFVSEPLDASTLTPSSFTLVSAGPDEQLDTADDVVVNGALEFRDDLFGAFLNLTPRLVPGLYRAQLSTAVTDLAGNALAAPVPWQFTVFDVGPDRDADGVPDSVETSLGLDPDNPDSDGDGRSDGDEDFDNDGLSNFGEFIVGSDPRNPDSDGDGIRDGDEDSDQDGLSDSIELRRGTNLRSADSDRDGWSDGAEVDAGSNPTARDSRPRFTSVAVPPVTVLRPAVGGDAGGLEPNTTVAQPPVTVLLPVVGGDAGGLEPNTTVAQPLVTLLLPAVGGDTGGLAPNTTVARPPVSVRIEGQ